MERTERDVFERGLCHAVEAHTGAALDAALVELGWPDALVEDTQEAVSIFFGLQGSAHASSSALDRVLACSIGLEVAPPAGFVLPPLGRWSPPGAFDGACLVVRGLGTQSLAGDGDAVVVAQAVNTELAFCVPKAELTLRPVHGIDPGLGLVEVQGTVAKDALAPEVVAPSWSSAVALAQLAVGYELVGAARAMLELAREHALTRVQFGQPIARFQAVRHRLAETLVGIEAAEGVLDAAWEDRSPVTAAVAKALAGRGARTASRHCQQVLAGIGFTTEHEFHRYAKRVLVLDELFGASRSLTRALGADLVSGRRMPAFAPL
jgi:Acyl-CoA dehydrogenase, C-terminal domain